MNRMKNHSREINKISKLEKDEVKQLWADPLLKTSDALSSIFHEVGIIVEGESDARFFRSMLDALKFDKNARIPDLRFFHCGGKDRLAKIASAFKAVEVPTVCIADIDVLNDKDKFIRLYEAMGGLKSDVIQELNCIHQFLSQDTPALNTADAKRKIEEIFNKLTLTKPLPAHAIRAIRDTLQYTSPWSKLKQAGCSYLNGDSYIAFRSIFSNSLKNGLLINEHGELNQFYKLGNHSKSNWLENVLALNLAKHRDLKLARDFTKQLVKTAVSQMKQVSSGSAKV